MIISYVLSIMHEFVTYISIHTGELIALIILFYIISMLSGVKMNVRFLGMYLLVVLYMTILSRKAGYRRMSLRPFVYYKFFFTNDYLRRQILNNILLFVPLGIILSQLRPQWSMVCLFPCISLGIEILQFITGKGLFEIDDIIHNSLGGIIGFTAGMLWILTVCQVHKLIRIFFCGKKSGKTKSSRKR